MPANPCIRWEPVAGAARSYGFFLVPTLPRGNACPGAPAPRKRPQERSRRVPTLEHGNQNNQTIRRIQETER